MKYNVLTYLIGEGFANVFKNKKQALTSIGMMCVTMLIFGIFFMIGENINHFVKQIESEQAIRVIMKENVTDEQIATLKKELIALDGINTVEFVSQAQALQQVKEGLKDHSQTVAGISEDIFPVAYKITFTDLSKSTTIQEQILKLDNVDEIAQDNKSAATLVKIAKGIKIATYTLSICLIAFAVFIISNTIKLTVHARRKEISIMKYVGATNAFIRWPFAVEGMIIGIISGTVSTAILSWLYYILATNERFISAINNIGGGLTVLELSSLINSVIMVYLALGIGIGVLGSIISMRKYLKV